MCLCVRARLNWRFRSRFFRPTFRRIIRNKSTEQFSGLPYIYALLNCLICLWYGTPIVSPGIILVFTVNSVGAVFQLAYILIFIIYAERTKKVSSFTSHWIVWSFHLNSAFCFQRWVRDELIWSPHIRTFNTDLSWKLKIVLENGT